MTEPNGELPVFQRILVPLDGSSLAERALPHAAFLAKETGGRLYLVRAVETWALTAHERTEKELEQKGKAEAEMSSVVERLMQQEVSVEWSTSVGEAAAVIDGAAKDHGVNLIAMSTHGRSGLARWAYGSVAERVLRLSSRPILLVPARCERGWQPGEASTIVVPLDGSPLAEEALGPAKALAKVLGGTIHLLQVVEPPPAIAYDSPAGYSYLNVEEWAEQAKPYVEEMVSRLRSEGLTVEGATLIGYAAATIEREAAAKNAAAIVMASHGRSGLARVVLGSVALGVVQRASMPVLVMRPASLAA